MLRGEAQSRVDGPHRSADQVAILTDPCGAGAGQDLRRGRVRERGVAILTDPLGPVLVLKSRQAVTAEMVAILTDPLGPVLVRTPNVAQLPDTVLRSSPTLWGGAGIFPGGISRFA